MTKIVIDTNVLIYGRDQSSAFHQNAVKVLTDVSSELYVTTKTISEYFAVCTKLGIKERDIWNFFEDLKRNTSFLMPDSESLIQFEDLITKYKPIGNRVYDMEIVSVMLSNGIQKLATANVIDFQAVKEIEIIPILRND
jgi:predicted nucleic acid-binding protein